MPRSLREGYAQARRDVRIVLDGLRGQHPPPLVPLTTRPAPLRPAAASSAPVPSAVSDGARLLEVCGLHHETADAVSVSLRDPSGAPIAFVPGQFLTLLVDVDGELLRRAYSIASPASETGQVRIGIKRVPGGRASNQLCDELREGQTLRVLGPSGQFTCASEPESARHIVLLGGGSGITPLLAIASMVLESEPASRVSLIYGNRGPAHVMFAAELEALQARYAERFELRHVFSDPPEGYAGAVGLLDAPTASAQLDALAEDARPALHYLCGPSPMMAACRQALLSRGVAPERIFEESFQPATAASSPAPGMAERQTLRVDAAGVAREFEVRSDQTLLDAGLAAGVALKFSCAMGGCGACKVKLVDGQVLSEEPNCLTAEEREAGYVLACVSRPRSACHIEVS